MSISYNTSIVTNGLVFCLDAGNPRCYAGTGTRANDVSGNGNTSTLNGAGYSSANLGTFTFDGNTNSITAPDSSSLAIVGDMTICSWINVTNFSTWRSIIAKTAASSIPQPYDYYLVSGSGVPRLFRGNGTVNAFVDATSAPATGAWQYIAATMSGTTVTHYLNNTTNGSGTLSTTIANSASNIVYVGYRVDGVTKMLGNMGPLMVYNRALSAAEVSQNFNAYRGRYNI